MAITYAQLLQATQDYTENTETSFVSNIPIFVRTAETRIYNAVTALQMRKVSTAAAMVAGTNTIVTPADFLAMFEFYYTDAGGAVHFLINKDANYIYEAYPVITVQAAPVHYALFTGTATTTTLLLGPTPDSNYTTTMDYMGYPASIVDASTTWVGNNCDTVILYGTLREAYVYLKGEQDLLEKYESLYQESLMALKSLVDGRQRQDMYRLRQTRVPPV